MYEALARDYPGEPNYRYKLSRALNNLSNRQYMLGLDSDSLRTMQRQHRDQQACRHGESPVSPNTGRGWAPGS